MNGSRIGYILQKDAKCRPMFLGVFACDELPTSFDRSRPAILVCNTDPHFKKGEHWIVLYIEDASYGEYFDSFGRAPQKEFQSFLEKHCAHWIFNDRQLQSVISHFCGHYCIFYCLHRCRGRNINAITNLLTLDTALNDYLVHNFVCSSYKFFTDL
jgi:Adenovirus endoprotease